MDDDGCSHQSLANNDDMALLWEFILAWRACTEKLKAVRAEAYVKMVRMRRQINANIKEEGRKLTIAVTFQKWREYGGVRRREREEERRQRKLAAARLAQAKRKPTAGMLKRRASVLAWRKSSLTGTSERKSSLLVSQMKLTEYNAKITRELVSIYEEKNKYQEANMEISEKIEELRRRQMKALAITRRKVEGWGDEGRSWATKNIERRTGEVRATTVALRDTIFSTDIRPSTG
ncbi:hypothetical protein TrRE_jg2637 [Triparma retinervis]|uniref:Uncharacterized protein n=1 Tax=Triparma retinervis TaxID=2557542 RepID=A0A9W6ZX92_9STRA|nr:hypothetical protein TrRE_jg2637 [Triparma retinervis]